MTDRVWAEIDLARVEHNFDWYRANVRVNKIMAVVKANAYGHGAIQVARRLRGRADCFGVANVQEGVELRDAGIIEPIVVLGSSLVGEMESGIEHNLVLSVSSVEQARWVEQTAKKCGSYAEIYLAINTGFNRLGMDMATNIQDDIDTIRKLSNVKIVGVFSHNNPPENYQKVDTYHQNQKLVQLAQSMVSKGENIRDFGTCASASCLDSELAKGNMARVGLGLYGYGNPHLLPVMSVYSRVVHIRQVKKGEKIGYSPSYIACKNMKIAVLSIGYADGYSLSMSCGGYVLLSGKFAKVIGKICMDMCMVDITDNQNVQVGDIALMWGDRVRLDKMLNCPYNSVYAMLCTIGKRMVKRYL